MHSKEMAALFGLLVLDKEHYGIPCFFLVCIEPCFTSTPRRSCFKSFFHCSPTGVHPVRLLFCVVVKGIGYKIVESLSHSGHASTTMFAKVLIVDYIATIMGHA